MGISFIFIINFLIISFLGIVLNRINFIIFFISIELMILGINMNIAICSFFLDDILGQVFSLFFLTVAASESAIGLAILVIFYKVSQSVGVYSSLSRK